MTAAAHLIRLRKSYFVTYCGAIVLAWPAKERGPKSSLRVNGIVNDEPEILSLEHLRAVFLRAS